MREMSTQESRKDVGPTAGAKYLREGWGDRGLQTPSHAEPPRSRGKLLLMDVVCCRHAAVARAQASSSMAAGTSSRGASRPATRPAAGPPAPAPSRYGDAHPSSRPQGLAAVVRPGSPSRELVCGNPPPPGLAHLLGLLGAVQSYPLVGGVPTWALAPVLLRVLALTLLLLLRPEAA